MMERESYTHSACPDNRPNTRPDHLNPPIPAFDMPLMLPAFELFYSAPIVT